MKKQLTSIVAFLTTVLLCKPVKSQEFKVYFDVPELLKMCEMDTSGFRKYVEKKYFQLVTNASNSKLDYYIDPYKQNELFIKFKGQPKLIYASTYKDFIPEIVATLKGLGYNYAGKTDGSVNYANTNYQIVLTSFSDGGKRYNAIDISKIAGTTPGLYHFSIKELEELVQCDNFVCFRDFVLPRGFKRDVDTEYRLLLGGLTYSIESDGARETIGLLVNWIQKEQSKNPNDQILILRFSSDKYFASYKNKIVNAGYALKTDKMASDELEIKYSQYMSVHFRITFSKLTGKYQCPYKITITSRNGM